MGKHANLKSETGLVKEVKVGFSWTTFFFGVFVPLIRGDIKWAAIMFGIGILLGSLTMGVGAWIAFLIFAFKYNEIYIKDLIEKGYKPSTEDDALKLERAGIVSKSNFDFSDSKENKKEEPKRLSNKTSANTE